MLHIQCVSVRQYKGTVAVLLNLQEQDIEFMAGIKTSALVIPFNVAASRLWSVVEGGETHELSKLHRLTTKESG